MKLATAALLTAALLALAGCSKPIHEAAGPGLLSPVGHAD